MWKILRRVSTVSEGEHDMTSVYDSYLNDAKKVMFQLIFSLASLVKITPKRLAVEFSKTKADEYAQKFHAELGKIQEKSLKDLEAELTKKRKTKD